MWSRLFELDPDSHVSLQQQIRESLVRAILNGQIGTETPLPSSRRLASELGVARNTVILAYQHLADEGYLIARERSGYFVNGEILANRAAPPPAPEAVGEGSEVDWARRLRSRPSQQRNITKPTDWQEYTYPFIYGQMDPRHFPANDWRECYRMALTVPVLSSTVRDHIDTDNKLLMEQIQSRVLTRRGIWISPDEIIGTMGSQNALYLLATLLMGPDTVVGVEDPGYPDARNIFSLRTRNLRPLPVDEGGLVVDERLDECDYVFVTPSHQSPTTVTMPLAICQRR